MNSWTTAELQEPSRRKLTSSDAERRHCTAACFFISSRLRSVPPFFLLLPHFFPVPFSHPKKMSFSFRTQTKKSQSQSILKCKGKEQNSKDSSLKQWYNCQLKENPHYEPLLANWLIPLMRHFYSYTSNENNCFRVKENLFRFLNSHLVL